MKKKIIALMLSLCLAGTFTACGSSDEPASEEESTAENETAENDNAEDTDNKKQLQDALDQKIDDKIIYSDDVRNDVTGNWRLARAATSQPFHEWAKDYYEAYFDSDDEIHYVVNFTLNTTSCARLMTDNILVVDVYERVDKEEHDAKQLGSGMYYGQYWVHLDTGEVERVSEEDDE